jgi:hypothetical protein
MAVPPLLGDNHALLFVLLRRGCLYVLMTGVTARLVSRDSAGHFLYPLLHTGVDALRLLDIIFTLLCIPALLAHVDVSFTFA